MENLDWIDRKEYPFKSHYLDLDMGTMHYVDEGQGEPILFLHGNPTWSFLYRHLIKCLSKKYRCVAPDHIGFGLSSKPKNWSYLPEAHAQNTAKLMEKLDLKNITLVMQDWGGPVGISYAVNNPDNVKRLVIMNTWMWGVENEPHARRFSKFMGGFVGKFMIRRLNFFVNNIMKAGTLNKERFTEKIHDHYRKPHEKPDDRLGSWVLPGAILGSGGWLNELWSQREKIADKKALILWAMEDIAFKKSALERWQSLMKNAKTIELENAGHYLQEDLGGELCDPIEKFMEKG